jgi:tetratricopeptide (TPR) repeat protein
MRLIAPLFAIALAIAPLSALAANQTITTFQPSGQEASDQAVVIKVMKSGSLQAAKAFEKDLVAVLDHAPAKYPQIERTKDMTIIRSTSGQGGMSGAILMSAINGKDGKAGTTATAFNVYPMAALLLGSIANERRDPRAALAYLDKGLAFQPDNVMLITEKGAALGALQRFSDALAVYQSADSIDFVTKMLDPGGEARVLRGKGFALIELKRLDEAEAAYVAALKLEPNHVGAKGELNYIRKLRAGEGPRKIELLTGDKAQGGGGAAPKP